MKLELRFFFSLILLAKTFGGFQKISPYLRTTVQSRVLQYFQLFLHSSLLEIRLILQNSTVRHFLDIFVPSTRRSKENYVFETSHCAHIRFYSSSLVKFQPEKSPKWVFKNSNSCSSNSPVRLLLDVFLPQTRRSKNK